MNLTRANSAVQQFLDFDGTPLSGGRLCTFIHGTTTPIATYKDKNGTLNECDVRLNSRGECDIWLDPSQSYKFVLKRADGSVVWTKDDITADAVYELPSRIVDTVEGSGDVDVEAVADGNSTKYVVKLTDDFKEEIEAIETAIGNVKDAFYFGNNVDVEAFDDAYSKGKFLVYQKGVTSGAPRPETTTRDFVLVSKNQRAGGSSATLLFACLEGETIYKVSIVYNLVAHTLTFGDVESYAVKGKDDELASTIASYQETTDENFLTMGTTLSQGLNQLETSKLSAVAHDGTLEGDGTEANPLKVIGGGQGGGGIPEAPEDGKQYARKDGEWTEVEATFTATYNDTSFADIASAVESGYCVKCDVSGYTYELVQALSDKITFALTNNVNGTISQETIWVTSEDEWDGEGVNLAKASDVPSNAVTSTAVTSIVKVTAMPENPDPNTLYLVVEEEATTASETSETEGEV